MTELPTKCDLLDDAPRYVAEAFKATEPNWVKRDDLVDNYVRPKPNNLSDLRDDIRSDLNQPDGKLDDYDINGWLIDRAITEIGFQNVIEHDEAEDAYRIADGVSADTLKLGDELLIQKSALPDLFGPKTGKWVENLRSYSQEGLKELRESMEALGWLREFPAIQDENGVIIVGHRRLAVAEQLGIEPVIKTKHYGEGDAGDAARTADAIASNVGFEKISATDRKKIAADLYGQGWSMEKIGKLLKVATMTVSRDLRNLTSLKPAGEKRGRPRKPVAEPKPEPKAGTTIVVTKASGMADAIADVMVAQMDAIEAKAKTDVADENALDADAPQDLSLWLNDIAAILGQWADHLECSEAEYREQMRNEYSNALLNVEEQFNRVAVALGMAEDESQEAVPTPDVANIERVAKRIVLRLDEHGRATRGAIRKSFSAPDRQYVEPALEQLMQAGLVVVADDGKIELGGLSS